MFSRVRAAERDAHRATTANDPFSGSGNRVTSSTDAASRVNNTTSPATTANARVSVRRVQDRLSETVSRRTDSCGTRAGNASKSADSGNSDTPRTTAVPSSRNTVRQSIARNRTTRPYRSKSPR